MYANAAPHASATPPVSHAPVHHHPGHAAQQHAYGQPGTHAQANASYGAAPVPGWQPAAPTGAAFVTGAYQPSGDAAIDRMLALEAAAKRFGSLI